MRREILASMKALATSSALISAGFFAQLNGWTVAPLEASWWSIPLMFAVSMVLFDAWFYWGHRLLHLPAPLSLSRPAPCLRRPHRLEQRQFHHRRHADRARLLPGDLVRAADAGGRAFRPAPLRPDFRHDRPRGLRVFRLPPPPAGPSPLICTTFHDLHHSGFRYNYGNFFSLWDRMMGTVDPRYDAMVRGFRTAGRQAAPRRLKPERERMADWLTGDWLAGCGATCSSTSCPGGRRSIW